MRLVLFTDSEARGESSRGVWVNPDHVVTVSVSSDGKTTRLALRGGETFMVAEASVDVVLALTNRGTSIQ